MCPSDKFWLILMCFAMGSCTVDSAFESYSKANKTYKGCLQDMEKIDMLIDLFGGGENNDS